MPENRRLKGEIMEGAAARFLMQNGVRILERNFHDGRRGEIDIIGKDGDTVVFAEVKYRSGTRSGSPEEAVTPVKQRTIIKTACYYLYIKKISPETPVRFDVLALTRCDGGVNIRWIRDAFRIS